jgi:hypothetical protein
LCIASLGLGQPGDAPAVAHFSFRCAARMQVGVKPSGAICAIQKDGHGALAPAAIAAVVQIAGDAAAYVFRRMAEEGDEDEDHDGNDALMLADD